MKKRCSIAGMVVVLVLAFSSSAYPWGYATHAYIAHLLNKKAGQRNLNEIYGAMAPDLFNFRFDLPVMGEGGLYFWTHYRYDRVWDQAETGQSKGPGYGFVSHNDAWGADYTAHHSGRTYGQDGGYVIAKAIDLDEAELPPEILAYLPPGTTRLSDLVGPVVAWELQHTFVEYGLDLLTKRLDPVIGERIAASAVCRSPEFPSLLVAAYAEEFAPLLDPADAAEVIVGAEAEFNESMYGFGQVLMLDEADAREIISWQLSAFADEYLGGNLGLPQWLLAEIIDHYVAVAMEICEDDFPAEIHATIEYVDEEMALRKIGNQR